MNSKLKHAALTFLAALAFGASARAETPDKWVRYVEATGSQYVDTGIVGRYGTKAEAKVEWMELADASFLSARKENWPGNGRLYFCYCLNANGEMYTASDTGENVSWVQNGGTWNCRFEKNRVYAYTAEFSALDGDGMSTNSITVDGLNVWSKRYAGLDTEYNLFVFANNQRGSANGHSKTRCYGLKLWQDGRLVRDFQPCMKGGRAGLYDAVYGKIFYSGSGTDLVCDENSEVPDEFIEYVESSGDAAEADGQVPSYIDTGIIGRSGTKAEGEFALLASEDAGLLGSRDNTKSDSQARFYLLQSYNSKITCGYGTHKSNNNTLELGKKYWVSTDLRAGSQTQTIGADGYTNTVFSAADAGSIDTGYPMYLFTCNVDGATKWFSKARCYGFKIWQNGALVRDFRPCLKNGVAGLYDDVSKRIFYSLGTPLSFDNRKPAKAKNIVFVEYIESDGNNTLDTGVPARTGLRAAGEMAWTQPGDYGNGYLRIWNHEAYRYLQNTAAPGVWYRQKRTYLGACDIKPKPNTLFYMVRESNSDMEAGYGAETLTPQTNGVNVAIWAGATNSFDVSFLEGTQTIEWNGETVLSETASGTVDTGDTLHLFSSSQWRHRSAARCFGLKIWQDGTLVRDFKPCLVDGRGMLYDMVTKCLYRPSPDIPASRTGAVVLSGEEKPVQYVEYVESDGTVFVDTGVVGRSGTAADVKMAFLESGDNGFLESRNGGNRFYLWHNYTSGSKFLYGYGGYFTFGTAAINTVYEVNSSLAAGAQTISVNGTQLVNASDAASINTGYNLYVFTCHQDGKPQYPTKARLYWLKLYQGNADGSAMQLVRNFRPVKLSNGLVVLWDFQNNEPYLPQSVTAPYANTTFPAVGPDGDLILNAFTLVIR